MTADRTDVYDIKIKYNRSLIKSELGGPPSLGCMPSTVIVKTARSDSLFGDPSSKWLLSLTSIAE